MDSRIKHESCLKADSLLWSAWVTSRRSRFMSTVLRRRWRITVISALCVFIPNAKSCFMLDDMSWWKRICSMTQWLELWAGHGDKTSLFGMGRLAASSRGRKQCAATVQRICVSDQKYASGLQVRWDQGVSVSVGSVWTRPHARGVRPPRHSTAAFNRRLPVDSAVYKAGARRKSLHFYPAIS